ncbi:MAG: hypothetical protein WCZ28_10130 [Burkholderiaceae bacterium]
MSRPINLDGLDVEMSMLGARSGKQTFTLAWVTLPDATAQTRERVVAAMADGMLRNIEADEIERIEREVPVVDAAGKRIASQSMLAVIARGNRPEAGTGMQAVFVARGSRAWQAVAIGSPLDEEAADIFLESFAINGP